jgi:LAS superfamily LD-carboxypeptidase LdcB
MTDPQQQQASGAGSTGQQPAAAGALNVPAEVQQKFGPLIDMIKASESMNNEERQYWINILPIMTPEQLKNLEDILTNEKKQLAAIDDKYSKEISSIGDQKSVEKIEFSIKQKRKEREELERKASEDESKKEEDILNQIQNF